MDKDRLFEIFMKYGGNAVLAYDEGNLEQYLMSRDVPNSDLGDFDDDEFETDVESVASSICYILNKIGFSQDQLRKLGMNLGEFMEEPLITHFYAEDVIKGRWPEAEDIIKKDAGVAFRYAKRIIKDRWPEAEEIIKQNHHYACQYAREIIGGRWPEAEDIIKKAPSSAFNYARFVIKGRWPEAEDTISSSPYWYKKYNDLL